MVPVQTHEILRTTQARLINAEPAPGEAQRHMNSVHVLMFAVQSDTNDILGRSGGLEAYLERIERRLELIEPAHRQAPHAR